MVWASWIQKYIFKRDIYFTIVILHTVIFKYIYIAIACFWRSLENNPLSGSWAVDSAVCVHRNVKTLQAVLKKQIWQQLLFICLRFKIMDSM